MKNEKERMQEYLQEHLNEIETEHQKINKIAKTINISLSTLFIIATIIAIIMVVIVALFIYPKINRVFAMDEKGLIKKIEKTYGQSIKIIEDNATKKGNGTYIFQTKKEPILEFHVGKNAYDTIESDFETIAFLYYLQHPEKTNSPEIWENIHYQASTRQSSAIKNLELTDCIAYASIENYEQIEQAAKQIYQIKQFLWKKIKTCNIPISIKIKDYISSVGYEKNKQIEDIVYEEQYHYYWYCKNNHIEIVTDDETLNCPTNLSISINDKIIENEPNETANFNLKERTYEIYTSYLVKNCDKFTLLNNHFNSDLQFSYQDKEYVIHYSDLKIRGNKLPYKMKVSDIETIFHAKVEYDFNDDLLKIVIDWKDKSFYKILVIFNKIWYTNDRW